MSDHLSLPLTFLSEASLWEVSNIIALVGLLIALLALAVSYWPIHKQNQRQRLLENSFGADFYDATTIENSTRYYVRPNCSSVDPAQEAEIRQVIATQEDLFTAIDKYLADDSIYRHILLLADSGMGKSSFVLNYYARNQQLPKRKRRRLAVVPLGIPNAIEEISKIENKKETVIFLDALDEEVRAIHDHRGRLIEIMQACVQFKRVLITCRTQFFPKDEEIPTETGIAKVGPRKPGESGTYEFWKLYLSPLNDEQVKEFLRRRYPFRARAKRKAAMELVSKIPLLSVRPMLLAYIPDVLETGAKIEYTFQLYELMVEKWLEREKHWADKTLLREFSENLAVDIYANSQRRGFERIPKSELTALIKGQDIQLEDWKITGRSLLNRDALGNYKFAHRSILEYLFIKKFTSGDERCCDSKWTDLMKKFLVEMVDYNLEHSDKIPFGLQNADLTGVADYGPLLTALRRTPATISLEQVNKFIQPIGEKIDDFGPRLHIYVRHDYEGAIVRDLATGLMWQSRGSHTTFTFDKAKAYIDELNATRWGGFNDWRLPTFEEALLLYHFNPPENSSKSIVDTAQLDPLFSLIQKYAWTSDRSTVGHFERRIPNHLFVIHFVRRIALEKFIDTAIVVFANSKEQHWVRAVRSCVNLRVRQ